MPATAGRVRMPANNRVHSSAALQTHGIWQSAIGYDPYAPEKDSKGNASERAAGEGGAENAYASFQGLLALARITGSSANDTRGACKKCGRVGHLTYQCRNFLSVKEDKDKDEVTLQNATNAFDKIKKANGLGKEDDEDSSSEEEESESSDSDVDPEIERIIAARMGKSKKRSDRDGGSQVEKIKGIKSGKRKEEDDERRKEKKRRKRRSLDEEDEEESRMKDRRRCRSPEIKERKEKKRRKRHESSSDEDSSEEDDRRRRRHYNKSKKDRRRHGKDSSDDEFETDERRHRSSRNDSDRRKSKLLKKRSSGSNSENDNRRVSKREER
ncbi:CAX interacting protein 4 [Wolffia australiana]